jgi:hypothetical protein
MFWADELAARLSGAQVVNDSKTPSGTIHVGSLRGPVIADVITRALRAHGLPTTGMPPTPAISLKATSAPTQDSASIPIATTG